MNCLKCNASLPEGKLFCPKCGYLNDTTSGSSKFETGQSQWLQLPPNLSKQKILAIFGGVLIIISYLFPWGGFFHGYQTGFKSFPQELIAWLPWVYGEIVGNVLHLSGGSGAAHYLRYSVYTVGGCILPFAGGITAYFAYTIKAKTRGASIITGMLSFLVLISSYSGLTAGKLVMLAGLICIIISLTLKYISDRKKRV